MMNQEVQSYVLEFNERGMKTVRGRIRDFKSTADGATKSAGALRRALGLLAGYMSISKIVEYTNAWQQLTNQLRIVTQNELELQIARRDLINMSRQSRADILATGKLYQRLAIQADNLGTNHYEMMKFVEGATKAMALTSPTAQEARSILLQLGQAMGTAAVNGDEFRTIAEGAPALIKAVADELNITTGEVKRQTREGKILSKDFYHAIINQLPSLREQFAKTDITLSQAGVIFTNSLKEAIGMIGEISGGADLVSKAIVSIADNLKDIVYDLMAAVQVLVDVFQQVYGNAKTQIEANPQSSLPTSDAETFAEKVDNSILKINDTLSNSPFFQTLLKTVQLAGEIFLDIVIGGFRTLVPLFEQFGRIIASFIKGGFQEGVIFLGKGMGKLLPDMIGMDEMQKRIDEFQKSNYLENLGKEGAQALIKTLEDHEFGMASFTDQLIPDYEPISLDATADDLERMAKETDNNLKLFKEYRHEIENTSDNLREIKGIVERGFDLGYINVDELKDAAYMIETSTLDFGKVKEQMKNAAIQTYDDATATLKNFVTENNVAIQSVDDLTDAWKKARQEILEGKVDIGDESMVAFIPEPPEAVIFERPFIRLKELIYDLKVAWEDFKQAFEKTATPSDMLEGVGEGIAKINREAMDTTKQFSKFSQNMIKGFSEQLTEALTGGEADFKAFARAAINQLISVMIQAMLTQAIMSAIGSFFPGSSVAGGITNILSGAGGATTGVGGVGAGAAGQFGTTITKRQFGGSVDSHNISKAYQFGGTVNNPIRNYQFGGTILKRQFGGSVVTNTKNQFGGSILRTANRAAQFGGTVINNIHKQAQFGSTSPVTSPVLVGERRPEMFIPNTSGRVANFEKGSQEQQTPIRIVNVGEDALDSLTTPAGEKVIMNILKKNKTSLRGMSI